MDAKDLRTESALSERNNDGSKYSQSGGIALHCDRNKSYQDIGSNSLAKVDVPTRPCAVIGPDRIVPPPAPSEAYLKKGPIEPWPCMDNAYHTRRPPEYPHKLASFQNPIRNISPRQTFQENMQRIMVPPSYNSVKISDDTNYVQMSDRNNTLPKNVKITMPPEAKFCDVPYTVYPTGNEQKNVRNPEMCISSVNPTLTRTAPHGWPSGSVNIRPTRTFGAPELYQYQEYPSCAGPRPVVPRPNRTVQEESGYVYADPFYHQEGNIRFKPYPTVKDRFPQQRYEYIGNYANSFHPPPAFQSHKYELQKAVPPHPYPPYPPMKYLDRVPEPVMDGYQRNQQGNYNIPYRNQIIHPNYGPVLGNCPPNKIHSYPPDAHIKTVASNKLPFDNAKTYIEYENGRPKMYPPSESYVVNEMGRMHPMKGQVIMPNYPTLNMHNMPPNPYYKKDNQHMKNYEYIQAHFRSMDPNLNIHNPMVRHQPVFSPNTSAISPTDSSASNDTSQTLGNSQEDCGYVSQSSTASVRSMDSGINRIPNDCLRKYYDSRYGPIIRTAPMMSKSELHSNNNSKEKRNIDVRQFFQMWNEGDEETEENNAKEVIIQAGPKCDNNFSKAHEVISQSNQEQLYVLGLVNVPSEELGKYEHIQKVSKLPENIKGYNHIELLNQFEEAIESSNITNYKTSAPKDFQLPSKVVPSKQATCVVPPRPLSPLDVEAKISQSVIHKEVGCNFEIKPCSPKMMNVEVATPVQNILAERAIEKVSNPVMLKSPRLNGIDENIDCNIMKRKDHRINITNESVRIPSCKMANTQFSNNNIDSIKNSYSLQDLESNSGLCLASLPRLDNDIELNFPEVNQQFINANKGDSSVSTSLRDLPSLELLEHSDNTSKDKLNDINSLTHASDVLKSPCIVDSEKEFSKLSKYRKSKPHLMDSKENQTHHVINAARTDSVIIKNPENAKNHGERSIFSPTCLSKQDGEIQQVPINLTSQGCITESVETSPAIIGTHDASKEKDTSVEIAIDFSLNKNTPNEKLECLEVTNDKETEILTQNTVEVNHSILDDHLTKLPTFSDCDKTIQDNLIRNSKIEEASIPSSIKCNGLETVPQILNDENTRSVQSPTRKEVFPTMERFSPMSAGEDAKELDDNTLSVARVDEINYNSSNSLLPIEFGTPAAEIIPTDDCDSYLMDIDKPNNIADLHSDKVRYNLMKNHTDDDNDLNKHNNTALKENVRTDPLSNTDEVNLYNKVCPKDAGAEQVINSELDIDEIDDPKENLINVTCDSTSVKDPRNINCNNFDLPNDEILDHDIYQSKGEKQETSSNFDLSSANNIVIRSPDNYQKEATDRETEFTLTSASGNVTRRPDKFRKDTIEREIELNLPSSNNIITHSPDDYLKKETINRENGINLLSPNNIVTCHSDDYRNAFDRENEFNISSPNNIVACSSDNCRKENTNRENEFNLSSPNNIVTRSPEDCRKETTDRENDLNLPSPNNTVPCSPDDYRKETTDCENELNSPFPNNTVPRSPDDYQKKTTDREIDLNLPFPNNTVPRSPDDYRKETTDRENELNLSPPNNINPHSPDDYRKETTDRENKSNFSSPNNIAAPRSPDDYQTEATNLENELSLTSPNNVVVSRSPDDYQTEVTDLENELNLTSPNNIVVSRSPVRENEFNLPSLENKHDCQTGNNNRENEITAVLSPHNIETHHCKDIGQETDSDNNSPSPNDSAAHSPNFQSQTMQEDNGSSELPSLNSIDTQTRENDLSQTAQLETDLNLPLPNDMETHSLNDCQSEVTDQEADSDLTVDNIIPRHNSIECQSEISNIETDSNPELTSTKNIIAPETNDVMKNKNTSHLLTKVSDYQIELSGTENKQCEDIEFLSVEEKKLEIPRVICKAPEPQEEKKYINLEIRYLSYGSKEMYSPWIQKLVMFCEGSTKNVNMNKDTIEGNDCSINKTEVEKMKISYDLDHYLEDAIENVSNQMLICNYVCTTRAVESENITSGDVTAMEEDSKIDNANIYNGGCNNTEEQIDNVIKPVKLHNAPQENDKVNPPVVCSHDSIDIKSKIDGVPTRPSIVNDIGNSCGKLELNVERASCYFSPDVHGQWDKQSNCSDKAHEQWNKPSKENDEVPNQFDTQSNCSDEVPGETKTIDETPELWDKQSTCAEDVFERWDKQSICNDEITELWDKQSHCSDGVSDPRSNQSFSKDEDDKQWDGQSICEDEGPKQWDRQSISNDEVPEQLDKQSTCNNEVSKQWDKQLSCSIEDLKQWDKQSDCNDEISDQWSKQSNRNEEMSEQSNIPSNCNYLEVESTIYGNGKLQSNECNFTDKKRLPLKRSLSDSALNMYDKNENSQQDNEENVPFIWPFKRRKMNNIQNDILAQNLCNIIQHNRRNSISAIYNEENVSFCILIDNSCIIAEEENEDQEKICYTELSDECLAEIQNDCTKVDENMTAVISTAEEDNEDNECEYSDSFVMQSEDEKVDESWVEDVACVETVISDDIAEDIEISGPSSPKDDVLSDNDESGVFSSSEHTDKVKYIYGDKMCNDDAQFVETLYNTPQMNVNKTLVQRETLISGEYYDNDSLERILSESNDQELSPYVPEYTEPVYSPGIIDIKETVENKENMEEDISYPLQSNVNPLDVVVDTGINKIDQGNVELIPIGETQDDTIHSCESSVDNVFTYKENDDNTNYTTSSSPEVSSTTSEEKNSGILLKITNYKGSRISQINDIIRDSKRPSCKFTEDKDYVQSHSNFPTHRPLLTKAAQKYIPPLKESIRDLKVKLPLPQHSLLKLKQLKISKDEPKVCKQNIPVPKVSKKPKPKFEDVLKSIDEIQIKMHKEKSKKSKKSIPKVVIKKNENGSHYASTSNKDEFNPDLTGRKWQPWVFIEKNHFIDKMAIKKKTKAIFNHRKRTYVLAEKFQKYKSVNSAKFVISPPISDCPSTGLKYTIRLKHTY